jgi:arylformamidase
MRKILLLAISAAIIGSAMPANAGPLRERIKERIAKREMKKAGGQTGQIPAPGATEYSYGSAPLQKLDFWGAKQNNAPLVIFVHGGGWDKGDKSNATGAYKAPHYTGLGYAFASINYRLLPEASVEQQAADVASAVSYLRNNASRLGIDASRIVLMGHSAGAHLVALIGTDPYYLRAAGLSQADLAGVITLDGACYDVPAQMNDGPDIMQDTYRKAFGSDPARQRALSPTWQAAAPNVSPFLIMHVERDDGTRQSEGLSNALRQAGVPVQLTGVKGKGLKGHMEINRSLGDPRYAGTAIVDAWLATRFGRRG